MNKLVLAGAGIATFLLLGGANAMGGGAEGGGSKKATAITGVVPGFDGKPGGPSFPTPSSEPSTSSTLFQPSQYLLDLISQKYSPKTPTATPITMKTSSYSANTYAGNTNPINPIAASREALYNPFASILSIPIAGTAVPGNPYGQGVSPLSNPKKEAVAPIFVSPIAASLSATYNPITKAVTTSSSGGSGSAPSTYGSSSSGSSGAFSSSAAKASVSGSSSSKKSLSSYSGYSPTTWR